MVKAAKAAKEERGSEVLRLAAKARDIRGLMRSPSPRASPGEEPPAPAPQTPPSRGRRREAGRPAPSSSTPKPAAGRGPAEPELRLPLEDAPRPASDETAQKKDEGALLGEIERLRSELEELKREKAGQGKDALVPQAAPAAISPLQPRGRGKPFNIHDWSGERHGRKAVEQPPADPEAPAGPEAQLVALPEAGAAAGEQLREAAPAAEEGRPPAWHPWIAQVSLLDPCAWAREEGAELPGLLRHVVRLLAAGDVEGAAAPFSQALALHLQSSERPHLALSASLPPLFASLRASPAPAADAAAAAYERCAGLLRGALRGARFGEAPPSGCPQDMARPQFVRELCSQAGLALDLARLGFVQRFEKRNKEKSAAVGKAEAAEAPVPICDTPGRLSPLPLEDGTKTPERARSRSRSRTRKAQQDQGNAPGSGGSGSGRRRHGSRLQRRSWAVAREEIEAMLARAGRCLEAVQMHMDRLHDEAERRLEQAKEAAEAASRTESMSQGALGAAHEERPPAEGAEPPPLPIADAEAPPPAAGALTATPAAVASAPPAAGSAPAAAAGDGAADALVALAPTFGQFLEQQLLPLYVADLPFDALRDLTERYCGVPLDSDDEGKAWKALGGRPAQRRGGKARRRGQRQRSRSARRGGAGQEPATDLKAMLEQEEALAAAPSSQSPRGGRPGPAVPAAPLGRLLEATGKDGVARRPPLRAQMLNSIVEKRRKDHRAPPDMTLGGKLPSRPGTAPGSMPPPPAPFTPARTAPSRAAAPSTPLVSMALLQSPLPVQSPWATAPSPVSMRSRVPRLSELSALSPEPPTPHWAFLDTPGRPGRR